MPDDFWLILYRVAHTSVRLSGVRGMSYRVISSGVTIRAVDFSKCSGIEEFPGNCWSFTLPFCCGFAPVSYRERDFKTVLSGSGNRKYLTQIFELLCRLNHLNWNYFCTKGFCSVAFAKSEAVWLCEASTKWNNPSNLADLFILCCIFRHHVLIIAQCKNVCKSWSRLSLGSVFRAFKKRNSIVKSY